MRRPIDSGCVRCAVAVLLGLSFVKAALALPPLRQGTVLPDAKEIAARDDGSRVRLATSGLRAGRNRIAALRSLAVHEAQHGAKRREPNAAIAQSRRAEPGFVEFEAAGGHVADALVQTTMEQLRRSGPRT